MDVIDHVVNLEGIVEDRRERQLIGGLNGVPVGLSGQFKELLQVAFFEAVLFTGQLNADEKALEITFPVTDPGLIEVVEAEEQFPLR